MRNVFSKEWIQTKINKDIQSLLFNSNKKEYAIMEKMLCACGCGGEIEFKARYKQPAYIKHNGSIRFKRGHCKSYWKGGITKDIKEYNRAVK